MHAFKLLTVHEIKGYVFFKRHFGRLIRLYHRLQGCTFRCPHVLDLGLKSKLLIGLTDTCPPLRRTRCVEVYRSGPRGNTLSYQFHMDQMAWQIPNIFIQYADRVCGMRTGRVMPPTLPLRVVTPYNAEGDKTRYDKIILSYLIEGGDNSARTRRQDPDGVQGLGGIFFQINQMAWQKPIVYMYAPHCHYDMTACQNQIPLYCACSGLAIYAVLVRLPASPLRRPSLSSSPVHASLHPTP